MSLDQLSIVIDVVDSFSQEINGLEADLLELKGLAEAVDDINIDVNVYGDNQISRLQAQLMALNGQIAQMRMSGIGVTGGGVGRGLSEADRAADSFDIRNVSMADFHNALAKLLPLIFTYIGALPAAIGGVIALGAAAISAAAGLAALGGLAAAGAFLQDDFSLQDLIDRVSGDFQDAFGPLMNELTPMFYSMLDGLESLFDAIAARGDTLLALRDDAAAFGNFMLDWIPNVMEAMGKMAEAFGPLFSNIADILRDMNMLRGLTEFMAEAAPAFFMFISSLWSLIETLASVSIGFMKVAAVVSALIDRFVQAITLGGRLDEQLGVMLGTVLSLATVYMVLSSVISTNLLSSLAALGTKLLALISTHTSYSAAAVVSTAASWGLAKALLAVVGAATLGFGALVAVAGIGTALSKIFDRLGGNIGDATDALRNFDDVNSSMGDFGGGGASYYEFNPDTSRTVINAPDAETGKRIARNQQFSKQQTDDYMASGG